MNIVNIMNFVRGIEPRMPELDLVFPVKKELELCQKYGYKNTFLMQYDAMLRKDFLDVIKSADEKTEVGIWIEVSRALVEKVGLTWNGQNGWDWDWHVNPGCLPAYTHEERRKLIDEIMRNFKETFGCYPKSAGSWVMDAYSMEYMQEKYDLTAFAICREQYGIDAYTLIGSYYNQVYYPAKKNNICPAQTKENQIQAPVFKLLGPDPVYNYGEASMYKDALQTEPPTIESAWPMGQDPELVRWFFESYFNRESMAFSYIQLGRENPFGWDLIQKGLPMQLEILKEYVDNHQCEVMTMSESSKWFRDHFEETPATALGAQNHMGKDLNESQWYNCKNYRINFVAEGDQFYIRDVYKFDENYVESYYDTPCKEWSIAYDNLPVMEGHLWRKEDTNRAGIYFEGKYKKDGSMCCTKQDDSFVIEAEFEDSVVKIVMTETEVAIYTDQKLQFVFDPKKASIVFEEHALKYEHKGMEYEILVEGQCSTEGILTPVDGKIVLKMDCR